ncbi:unnamed protein product [Boreogadus saida]
MPPPVDGPRCLPQRSPAGQRRHLPLRLPLLPNPYLPLPLQDNPHLPLRLPLLVCNDAYPVHSTPPPAGQNNACFTPAATPDSGPNCSPTPSPSRRAFPDIMASLDVQPRLMEARPDPDTPAQMRAAVARYLVANALKDKALSTASPSPIQPNNKSTPSPIQPNNKSTPSPIQPNNKSTPSPTQHSSSSYNPAASNISIQPSVNSSCNPTPNPTQPRTSNLNNCNPTPNPTQPRTSRPKEEWLEHLIHHFNLSKKKQKKETQQEGSLGELLKQMCKMNIEKDMEAIRQLKERAEENLDLMAMMSLMTHQQETFPQVTPLPEWIRQGNLPTTYTTYVAVAMEQPSTKQNYPYGRGRPGRDKAMRLFPCMHCNQMGHWIRKCPKYHSDIAHSRFPSQQQQQSQQQQNTGFKTLPAAGNAMLALQQ